MNDVYCRKCRMAIADTDVYCRRCGFDQRVSSASSPTQTSAKGPIQTSPVIVQAAPPRFWTRWMGNDEILTNADPYIVLQAVEQAMHMCGVTNVTIDRTILGVEGTSGMDAISFGQKVVAQLGNSPEGVVVYISSRPRYSLFDWGRGKEESRAIAHTVMGLLEKWSR